MSEVKTVHYDLKYVMPIRYMVNSCTLHCTLYDLRGINRFVLGFSKVSGVEKRLGHQATGQKSEAKNSIKAKKDSMSAKIVAQQGFVCS